MTSLLTNTSAASRSTRIFSVALYGPFASDHVWQPRIWWRIVIVLGACADALATKIAATMPRANAAIHKCFFRFMVPPLLRRTLVANGAHLIGGDADSPAGIPQRYQRLAAAA